MGRRHKRRVRESDLRTPCGQCGRRILAKFLDARGLCESCHDQLDPIVIEIDATTPGVVAMRGVPPGATRRL